MKKSELKALIREVIEESGYYGEFNEPKPDMPAYSLDRFVGQLKNQLDAKKLSKEQALDMLNKRLWNNPKSLEYALYKLKHKFNIDLAL